VCNCHNYFNNQHSVFLDAKHLIQTDKCLATVTHKAHLGVLLSVPMRFWKFEVGERFELNTGGVGTAFPVLLPPILQPLTPTVAIMGTAVKHPVPNRVKPSFVIFDIRALWRSLQLYPYGNSGRQRVNHWVLVCSGVDHRRLAIHRDGDWQTTTLHLPGGDHWRHDRHPHWRASHLWVHRPAGEDCQDHGQQQPN